ncbi:MAG: tetratricopeptide repeat protein [Phycisphaerae bacterium]
MKARGFAKVSSAGHRGASWSAWCASVALLALGVATMAVGVQRHFQAPPASNEPVVNVTEASWTTPPMPEDLSELEPVLVEEIAAKVRDAGDFPDDPEPLGRLGLIYEAHGYSELAMECYEAARSRDPALARWQYHWAVLAQKAGDAEAEGALREVIEKEPDYAPAHERLGLVLLDRNAYSEAAEVFQHVIDLRPYEAPGHAWLGRVRLAEGNAEASAELFKKAIGLAPRWGLAHYLLAQAYQQIGRVDDARIEFARGARTDPSYVYDPWRADIAKASVGRTARLKVADSLKSVGRVAEAVQLLEDLLETYPTDTAVVNNLAVAYLSTKRPRDARRILERALEREPNEYLTHNNLVAALLQLGDLNKALEHAEEAVRLGPTIGRPYYAKATVLNRMGRVEDALAAYRRSAELDPSYPRVHSAMAQALGKLGRSEEAVAPWEAAVKLQPQNWFNQYNLGLAYARVSRFDDAVVALRIAAGLNPRSEDIRRALERAAAGQAGG